jgi:hypothetical protein
MNDFANIENQNQVLEYFSLYFVWINLILCFRLFGFKINMRQKRDREKEEALKL